MLRPFSRFCVHIGAIPESIIKSLSYEEQLLRLIKFLKCVVIPAIDGNTNAIKEIEEWINNVDLQDEVNNKLDEMAESGQLTELISEYLKLKSLLVFDNVQKMKESTNLVDGSTAITLGYYSKGDGGSATYKVREVTNQDTENDMDIIALNDTNLVAEFVPEEIINVKQFGAKGDGNTNDTISIQFTIDYSNNHNKLEVYIPVGTYIADKVDIYGGIKIYGENKNLTILKSTNLSTNSAFVYISGAYTDVGFMTIQGTDEGNSPSGTHEQTGVTFVGGHDSWAYRLHIHDLEVTKHTGTGIYSTHVDGYLADSIFENLFVSYNNLSGLSLSGNSDFKITNSYFATNRYVGCEVLCSNVQIENCKAYINGVGRYDSSLQKQNRFEGFKISSLGAIVNNCTAQENYGHGFYFTNLSSCSVSNLTSDANGILGWETNHYDLQHHSGDRVKRSSGVQTNLYGGFTFNNCQRCNFIGLNALSFIDINVYGVQMSYLYLFNGSDNKGNTVIGRGVVASTSQYNTTTFDEGDVIIINNKILKGFDNFIEKYNDITISDVVTGNSGSFQVNIPDWVTFTAWIRIGQNNSTFDVIQISGGKSPNATRVSKVTPQSNVNIENVTGGIKVNVTSGGLYSATIESLKIG